jgi:hypothetical protein
MGWEWGQGISWLIHTPIGGMENVWKCKGKTSKTPQNIPILEFMDFQLKDFSKKVIWDVIPMAN